MREIRRLTVPGRYENIPLIADFVGQAAAAAGLDETGRFHCQMAADEACTNIIEHAYGGEGVGDIEVVCTVEPGLCQVEIFDQGKPFDPAAVPEPPVGVTLEELKPGGIGLYLMRQVMDEVRFEFGEHSNRLVMIKRQPPTVKAAKRSPLRVEHPAAGVAVLIPEGRLDSSAAPLLEQALRDLLDQGYIWLVVDMAEVTYISSRGLKVLLSAWRITRQRGGDLALCALQPAVYEIVDTIGFNQLFTIAERRDEALAALTPHA